MILSSVNFVKSKNISNNGISSQQFTDFILGKIREDQGSRKTEGTTYNDGVKMVKKTEGTTLNDGVKMVKKTEGTTYNDGVKMVKETKNVFNFENVPSPRRKLSVDREITSTQSSTSESQSDPFITIQTSDGYFLSADPESRRFYLEDTAFPTHQTCTFQQLTLKTSDNNQTHVVFRSMVQGEKHYLTVDADRRLVLQEYSSQPRPDTEDERVFVKYEINPASILLQPFAHKGCYLHHLDQNLDVRRLEINWRPPEEFFFELGENDLFQNEIIETFKTPEFVADDFLENNFTLSREKRNVIHKGPMLPGNKTLPGNSSKPAKPSLLLGCFGMKSRKSQKKMKSKR